MRSIKCGAIVASVAIAVLAPAATSTAATSVASSTPTEGRAVTSCIKVTATIPVGIQPVGVAVNARTRTIYVANSTSDTVSVINGRTNTAVATVPVGRTPGAVAVNAKTNTIY